MANSVTVGATNNADIDGLLSGYKWTGTITYSFPDSASDYSNPYYGGNSEPTSSGFAAAPSAMQAAINYAIGLILGYTNASIQYVGTDGADIMIAQSSKPPTSYAYYPGDYAAGGDVWFGTQYDYSQAKLGNYYFTTAMHELGHALGLKHSQETGGPANVAVPSAHDDSEYTIMSYRSYVGASTTAGSSNEAYGYPQTYMANDILALQTMYGANYATQGGNTVYSWNPTTGQEFINGVGQLAPGGGTGNSANRIYETIWDGGGIDTYDLSNYTTNLSINLNPGATSLFSTVQQANLGDNQKIGYDHYASGNVYNAYLYNNDARSYIDNAIGGSGNDTILGNVVANLLNGGSGNDTITGGGGNDAIIGGAGTDTAVYSANRASYIVSYDASTLTFTLSDLRFGSPDGTDTVKGVEYFQFAGAAVASSTLMGSVSHDKSDFNGDGDTDILWLNDTGATVLWLIDGSHIVSGANTLAPSAANATLVTGDFNGDGVADILSRGSNGSLSEWIFADGQFSFADSISVTPDLSWKIVGSGDFDGDGTTDLLWRNKSGLLTEWQMSGSTISAASNLAAQPDSTWHVQAVADFNGDGKSDILWRSDSGTVNIWTMNGAALSGGNIPVQPDSSWHIVGAGDFDGNGSAEILWRQNGGQTIIWSVSAGQSVSGQSIGSVPDPSWHIAEIGDFNGDGHADILWQNTSGALTEWNMNGAQIVSANDIAARPDHSWHVVTNHYDIV
ncbi:FG-GAP-like repeat-containing protein [Bradyrhizobium sp. RT3a]|uniref:FG-GAP-like repeat-containing protein n=1 Tax=unclassified Bradyrhizobium TaxID=2631580 RepID=UPI0033963A86